MAQLLTHPDVKEGLAAAQKAAPEKEEKKAQQPWTLAGMPYRDWLKQQAHVKAQRKEEEKKAKAQAAEVKKGRRCCCQGRCRCAPGPPPPPSPPQRPAMALAQLPALVALPPAAAARGERKRGVKRPRGFDE